jgi:chromatin segregation and condensation protein Rec8/ScpA/Scc1 (kleisin family)
MDRIGLFLALLELAREQRVRVRQEKPGDAIELELRDSATVPNQASASSNAAP